MAKRFTDNTKWTNNKWFFNLSIESKLFWIYLLDSCDQVGVWEENVDLANKIIGYEYSINTLLKDFEKQIYLFKDKRKWWIVDFCQFQYGELREDSGSKPIQSYISLLKKHTLWKLYKKGLHTLKDKEEDKEKEMDEEKEKVIYPFDSENFMQWWNIWKEYKRKEHKFKYASEASEQAALKELSNLSNTKEQTAIAIIEQSLANGWKGFFELKEQKNNPKNLKDQLYQKYVTDGSD